MNINFSLKDLDRIIHEFFIPKMKTSTIFTINGPLGVGKTTIIKKILKLCGIRELITSPTFNYVNSYKGNDRKIFYHFDLYRLDSLNSFLNLGFDEYLNSPNSICFIEWPEIIKTLLDNSHYKKFVCDVVLSFDLQNNKKRIVEFS